MVANSLERFGESGLHVMDQLAYIFVAQVLIAAMLAAILLLCWLKVDRQRHALVWAVAFAVVTISYGLNVARGLMPQPVRSSREKPDK